MTGAKQIAWGARADVTVRIIAAIPLNYGLTSLLTVLLARVLPGGPAEASLGAMTLSFLIFAGLALAAFAVRSAPRLIGAMLLAAAATGALDWWLIAAGGRL